MKTKHVNGKTYRPWKTGEIPVHAVYCVPELNLLFLGSKDHSSVWQYEYLGDGHSHSPQWLLDNAEVSFDSGITFQPCGVEINKK